MAHKCTCGGKGCHQPEDDDPRGMVERLRKLRETSDTPIEGEVEKIDGQYVMPPGVDDRT